MKKIISVFLIFCSYQLFAEDKSVGCGVGQMIAPQKSWVSVTTRYAIEEAVGKMIPYRSFAMTTGTSGCAKHSIVLNEKRAFHYVESNYETLVIEMAQGHGESIQSLAKTFDCSDSAISVFITESQKNYSDIFNTNQKSPINAVKNINNMIKTNSFLNKNCLGLII